MSDRLIYHDVNSSIYLESEGYGILIDGLWSRRRIEGYTPYDDRIHDPFVKFSHVPAACLFTHHHPDHLSYEVVNEKIERYQGICWIEAGKEERNEYRIGPFRITGMNLRHSGYEKSEDNQIPHSIFLIEREGRSYLFTGDAEIDIQAAEKIREQLGSPTVLFVNPLQLAKDEKRAAVGMIGAERIVIIHLPEKEDDSSSMWKIAEMATRFEIKGVYPEIAGLHHFLDV